MARVENPAFNDQNHSTEAQQPLTLDGVYDQLEIVDQIENVIERTNKQDALLELLYSLEAEAGE